MVWHLERFRDILVNAGPKAAFFAAYEYVRNNIYKRLGLYDYIRSHLLVDGPPTVPHALYVKLYQPLLERKIGTGMSVMDRDWDNLIILDSYRADYFEKYSDLDGELSTVVSKGNWSLEFIVKNFQNGRHHDTVVVTANGYYQKYSKIDETDFHTLSLPIESNRRSDPSPENVTEAALDVIRKHPNKRIIVHYMQPHQPHIGDISDNMRETTHYESFPGMLNLYKRGEISKETLENSYIESIEAIESEIRKIANEMEGKTVVSSDHGENLGEIQHGMTQLGHGNPTPECRYVPWLEMDYDRRRTITSEPPVGFDTPNDEDIEERLKSLGYK